MEVYAGFLEQTDYNVGRVVKAIEDLGQLDNTLVIYIAGDNGASAEGSLQGLLNEMTFFNGVQEDLKEVLKRVDEIGTWKTYNHYPVGWAHAMCTPFQWTKQIASHYGGTRNGMVISWPKGIAAQERAAHAVAPRASTSCRRFSRSCGVPQPDVGQRRGSEADRRREHGVHVRRRQGPEHAHDAVFRDARQPGDLSRRLGGLHHARSCRRGVRRAAEADVITGYKWELYNTDQDFSQADEPRREDARRSCKDLQLLFYTEAAKYNVLPLDNSKTSRLDPAIRPSLTRGRKSFTFYDGRRRIPEGACPDIKNKSWSITAEVEVKADATGMIITQGGLFGGWALYLDKGKPVFHYNFCGRGALRSRRQGRTRARQAHDQDGLRLRRRRHRQGRHRDDHASTARKSPRAGSRRRSRSASPSTKGSTSARTPARRSISTTTCRSSSRAGLRRSSST